MVVVQELEGYLQWESHQSTHLVLLASLRVDEYLYNRAEGEYIYLRIPSSFLWVLLLAVDLQFQSQCILLESIFSLIQLIDLLSQHS